MRNTDTIDSLKARRNGRQAKPNVYRRSQEARDTTDGFLRLAAGLDSDPPKIAWWRRLQVWQLGLLLLGAIGLIVVVLNGIR